MEPAGLPQLVRLDSELDEFGMRPAFAAINENDRGAPAMEALGHRDRSVFETMLAAMGKAGRISNPDFANPPDINPPRHHPSPAGHAVDGGRTRRSVTNPDGRFHLVTNAFAGDLAAAPTSGSANPMLPGVALARRLARHLVPEGDGRLESDTEAPKPLAMPRPVALSDLPRDDEGFSLLFDGATTAHWRMAGSGQLSVIPEALQTRYGNDLGLAWCSVAMSPDFVLPRVASGAPGTDERCSPRTPASSSAVPTRTAPRIKTLPGCLCIEVQSDPQGLGPKGEADVPTARTGAVRPGRAEVRPDAPPGRWNQFEIRVEGQRYRVLTNREQTADITFEGQDRGPGQQSGSPSFMGAGLPRGQGRLPGGFG